MTKTHLIASLIETNKKLSALIDRMQSADLEDDIVIENVNDAIRELDKIVEHLERQ